MRISIVTPYYNIPEHYFKPFLRSVLSQDWDDYELLIINDGSTRPECLKLLEEVDDEHVRILSKPNGGLSSARNFGLFDTTITRHEDKLWALKLMKWVKKGRASDFVGYIYNLNPNGLTLDKSRRVRLQNSSYRAYDLILEYVESVAGRSSVYYEAMACYYCVCQWYLMQWIADRKTEDPDRAMRKDKLRTLHRELKGKGVTSREYSWRKWLTPLVLLLT